MYLPVLLTALLSGTALAASNTYRLIANTKQPLNTFFYQLTYMRGIYIGQIKFNEASEPFVLTNPSENGNTRFLSYHTERYQDLTIYPNGTQPVTLSPWQFIPEGATNYGFKTDGGVLKWNGQERWYVCGVDQSTYQVYWIAEGQNVPDKCTEAVLKVEAFGVCT